MRTREHPRKALRILVTGGGGFIGRNAVDYFQTGHAVLAPPHAEVDLLDADAVRAYLECHPADVLLHCAVRPGHRNAPDPTDQLNRNLRMFFNLVRNRSCFGKLIVLGSGLVYGMEHYHPRMREDFFDHHVPSDEGGFSKYLIARHIEQADGMVELRPFGVFGKYEDYAVRFISNAICKALFDRPITLRRNRRFDYVCVGDLLKVVEYFLEHEGRFKAYNVTPDRTVELAELAETVRHISGADVHIHIAQEGMGVEYSGDNARLKGEIPSLVFTPMEAAVEKLWEWYRDHRELINPVLLKTDR